MELTVKERIVLLNIMPKEGDFKTLKQLREFREKLAFTDEENKMLNFASGKEGFINWTEPVDGEFYKIEAPISDSVMAVIVEQLQSADKQKKLNDDTFALYEKFVEPIDAVTEDK